MELPFAAASFQDTHSALHLVWDLPLQHRSAATSAPQMLTATCEWMQRAPAIAAYSLEAQQLQAHQSPGEGWLPETVFPSGRFAWCDPSLVKDGK